MPTLFDPRVHLSYAPPVSSITMEELGKRGEGISPIGVTQPFPLLSEEGVRAMREEVFSSHVLERCTHYTKLTPCAIRGMACRPGFAPFVESMWNHPETLRAVSEAAGLDLVPIMPYELGHVNVQLTHGRDTLSKLGREPLQPSTPKLAFKPSWEVANSGRVPELEPSGPSSDSESDSDEQGTPKNSMQSELLALDSSLGDPACPQYKSASETMHEHDGVSHVVGWHRDSYPWVCVVMLSDASTMRGGETALACTDGSIKKVRGPQMGWAMMLQGKYIDHVALGANGAPERVTMVTSFRANDVTLKDESILTTIRPAASLNELYFEWSTYRLDLLSERFRDMSQSFKQQRGLGQAPWGEEVIDKETFKTWCYEQMQYLQTTMDEMV